MPSISNLHNADTITLVAARLDVEECEKQGELGLLSPYEASSGPLDTPISDTTFSSRLFSLRSVILMCSYSASPGFPDCSLLYDYS
jgi:hypothetical protein